MSTSCTHLNSTVLAGVWWSSELTKLPSYWPQESIVPQLLKSPLTFDPGQLELWWMCSGC